VIQPEELLDDHEQEALLSSPRNPVLCVEDPPTRRGGTILATVDELIARLRERGVLPDAGRKQ